MSSGQTFCNKCGSPITPGSAFCSKCGTPVAAGQTAQTPQPMGRRDWDRYEKHEKQEKHEKGEKGEKNEKGAGGSISGPLVGGGVLIWLGVTFYLQTTGYLSSTDWWAYFVGGLGVLLILDGLFMAMKKSPSSTGLFIGGAILLFIGASSILSAWQNLWPLFLVLLGAVVIVGGLTARRRSPTP